MEQGQRWASTGTTLLEGMLTQLLCGPLASAPRGDFRPVAAPAGAARAAQAAPAGPKLKAGLLLRADPSRRPHSGAEQHILMRQLGLYLLHCSPQPSAPQGQSSSCLSAFA